jgi:hypothetical protein
MSGHTPGPWALNTDGPFAYLNGNPNAACPWFKFASVVVRVNDEPCLEGEANARLIAAAPELLRVARNMLAFAEIKWGNLDEDANEAFSDARAAIARATGAAS